MQLVPSSPNGWWQIASHSMSTLFDGVLSAQRVTREWSGWLEENREGQVVLSIAIFTFCHFRPPRSTPNHRVWGVVRCVLKWIIRIHGQIDEKRLFAILHFFILSIQAKSFFFGSTFLKNDGFGFLKFPRGGMSRIDSELF